LQPTKEPSTKSKEPQSLCGVRDVVCVSRRLRDSECRCRKLSVGDITYIRSELLRVRYDHRLDTSPISSIYIHLFTQTTNRYELAVAVAMAAWYARPRCCCGLLRVAGWRSHSLTASRSGNHQAHHCTTVGRGNAACQRITGTVPMLRWLGGSLQ
jgi:hypothetical protein